MRSPERVQYGEIANPHPLLVIEKNVGGLQIPVSDIKTMRVVERTRDLLDDPETHRQVHGPRSPEDLGQRLALHVLHGIPQESS